MEKSLAMTKIQDQVPRRGSISAAYLQIASTGTIDATCRLFGVVQHDIVGRPIEPGTIPVLDSIQPEVLAEKLQPQLAALQKLRDPGLDPEQQHNALAVVQQLHAGLPTDLSRDVTTRAKAVVSTEMEYVRSGLRSVYGAAPCAIQELAMTIRETLDRTRPPDANWKSVIRWGDLKRIGDKLQQRRSVLPPSTLKMLQEALTSEGRDLYQQSLAVLAAEKTVAAWQTGKTEFLAFLNDLSKWSMEVVAALSAVKKCLEAMRASIASDQQVSRASVVKALPGPTADQVIAGMLTQLQAADEADLARIVLASWEARLRAVCPKVCAWVDRNAPLPDLLRGIPPEVQAQEFHTIVEESRGPGQSLYEILKREGIKENAEFLYSRSEPTVHLSGRDMAQLGLSPQRFCIVTLPKPSGPQDGVIRDQLMVMFEKINPDTTFADAPPSDRTVTVIRLLDGFVIGIEGQNRNLLNHYLYAAAQGHRPHLFDLIPDSPDGKALDDYLALDHLSSSIPSAPKEHSSGPITT